MPHGACWGLNWKWRREGENHCLHSFFPSHTWDEALSDELRFGNAAAGAPMRPLWKSLRGKNLIGKDTDSLWQSQMKQIFVECTHARTLWWIVTRRVDERVYDQLRKLVCEFKCDLVSRLVLNLVFLYYKVITISEKNRYRHTGSTMQICWKVEILCSMLGRISGYVSFRSQHVNSLCWLKKSCLNSESSLH